LAQVFRGFVRGLHLTGGELVIDRSVHLFLWPEMTMSTFR